MKKILLIISMLTIIESIENKSFAQLQNAIADNYPGVLAGVEWNTLSGLVGIEYERIVWRKGKVATGLKGAHLFKHENGNLQLFNDSYEGSVSFSALMPTVHYFTSRQGKINTGFFLHSGVGVGWRKTETSSADYNRTIPCFETGFGYQFDLGGGLKLKCTNTVLFAGEGGITSAKLSLGF